VIIAAPPPPAAELLRAAPDLAARAASARIAPCWAVMVQFPTRLELDYDGAFVADSPLAWIARNAGKPDRDPRAETWILHAQADWSTTHLEDPAETVQAQPLNAFWNATGAPAVTPTFLAAHRWRYALPVEPLPDRALFDADLGIGACGDWCSGPRVEGAYLSGAALAGRVLGHLTPSSS
jgi:renalase